MARAHINEPVNASADAVWGILGEFGKLLPSPMLKGMTVKGEGVGAIRSIELADGGVVNERCEAYDGPGRSYSYAVIGDSPMPLTDYLATVTVLPEGAGCRVDWSSTFKATGMPEKEAVAMIEGIYSGIVQQVRETLKG